MSSYAHITNGIVDSVIVIDTQTITDGNGWFCPSCGVHKPLSEWIETDEDTIEGTHKKGDIPLRKNYAGIGFVYDPAKDAFIPPKPFASWIYDEQKAKYISPKVRPAPDGYSWDESKLDWVKKL